MQAVNRISDFPSLNSVNYAKMVGDFRNIATGNCNVSSPPGIVNEVRLLKPAVTKWHLQIDFMEAI
ncbi:MAG: hypothetical protein FD166_680 [Bacteroidetes bacterium]|nr:MAG: hypothetical protein FD166_680 [Bacteroidota bacterium]